MKVFVAGFLCMISGLSFLIALVMGIIIHHSRIVGEESFFMFTRLLFFDTVMWILCIITFVAGMFLLGREYREKQRSEE